MILTIDEIKSRVRPVAEKYKLNAVYVFGSYARNEARVDSDIDILVDTTGSTVRGWAIGELYEDLCRGLGKEVSLVDTDVLEDNAKRRRILWFGKEVLNERVTVYERA